MHKRKGDCDMIGCPICSDLSPRNLQIKRLSEMSTSPLRKKLDEAIDRAALNYIHDTQKKDLYPANCIRFGASFLADDYIKLYKALEYLLSDSQHKDHDCGDKNCPVDIARKVIKELNEKLGIK